jgi:hypothetical protein
MLYCLLLEALLGKVHPITGHQGPRGGVEVQLYSFLTSVLRGGGWSAPHLGRVTPGKDPVPIVQGPQGRFRRVQKILPPPGFDPRTVQPIASRCTDWATQPNVVIGVT